MLLEAVSPCETTQFRLAWNRIFPSADLTLRAALHVQDATIDPGELTPEPPQLFGDASRGIQGFRSGACSRPSFGQGNGTRTLPGIRR